MKKKLLNVITVLGAIIAVITGIYTIYHEVFENKSPTLNIAVDNIEQATRLAKIAGLKAQYVFKERKIKDLWVADISIENISNVTIIGKGDKKNIIDDSLTLGVNSPYRLLDGLFTDTDFNDIVLHSNTDTTISFKFTQWRPKERVKVRFFMEGDTSKAKVPSFWMNDRQIVDGRISYEKREKRDYKGYLPNKIDSVLVRTLLGAFIIFVLMEALVVGLLFSGEYMLKLYKYRNWKSDYYDEYKKQVSILLEEKIFSRKYEPYELPEEFWVRIIDVPKPGRVIKDNQIYFDFTLAIVASIGVLLAILWIWPMDWLPKT